ncbi:microtubule-associated protein 4 isoform X2 [Gadus morhua]|uniref:microtubule-associated protein 4 isoform X2 n=1 Tax=Gadus morhua TaxID=8049 RepID=UPI0011B6EDA1|nr:microtubule-associated protein 4-like isoform X2 [Gadus morhua]
MAQLDLSLSDALSDCAAPGPEPRVERDFVAQLEAEAFDDQIGETVGKTDYIPLLDGDGTAPDIGTALANGEKKAEGAQKPGSKVTATMQPGRPEPHGEVRPRVDPPDMASDLLSASMLHSPGPQLMGFSPMGASSGFMEVGVSPLPAERPPSVAEPQQHSPMLPEPQAPRGPLNLAPGASPLWSDTAHCPPADLPFTDSVSTVISRHANQLASDARPPRESGGDEKEAEASDRKQQKKKKKRRQKDEGSWDQPEATEAPSEGPAPADDPYQRVGPRRDKGGPGVDGAWEEQIGKNGGRGKRGKSRKKLPEEWAATAEPFLPAGPQGPAEVGAAAPSLPAPEEPFPGTEAGGNGRSQAFHPEEGLVPDLPERDLFSCPAPLPVQSSGLKATAAPFTMPAGSSPLSPGPARSLSATPHEHDDGVTGDELDGGLFDAGGVLMASYSPYPILTDPSVLSPASQLSPDQYLKMGASPRPTGPSDSSWLAGDSGDLFDLGDYPASLGCPFPPGVVLDATGPAPLRSPRTSAQDCRGPPRERPDEATANKKHRSSSSSSSSSLKSPTFGGPPSSAPPRDCPAPLASSPQAPLGSPGSYLNPAAKPFFPGLNEPLEAPAVAPGVTPVMEDSQTPVKSDTKEDKMEESMEDKMDDGMERLDEYVQLDEADRRSVRVELAAREEEQEKHHKSAAAEEKETEKETEKGKQAEKVAEKMEDRVEKTPDKPPPADMVAKGVEEKVEKTIHVSAAHEDQETVVLEPTTPAEKAKAVVVTEVPEKPEAGDAKGTEISKAPPSPEKQPTTALLDAGSATPEKHSNKSTEDDQVEDTKVEKSKVEVTSLENTKVEKSKVEVTSLEDTKVEKSKVEVTSLEDTKVEKSKVEVTSLEDTKVEKSNVEVTSVEDTKVEKSKVEVTSLENTKVEESKVEVTSLEDTKVEEPKVEEPKVEEPKVEEPKVEEPKVQEPTVSVVEKELKTEEEALTEERHDEAEPELQQEEKPAAAAVETKDKAKEEVKKTAEKKEVKKEDSKEKAGKADAVTKKPSARPPTGSLKEPSSPEKKTKPAATATKPLPATKARPVSAAAPPTRRPASSLNTTTTFNNSTSISAPLAKKTLAARPATAPTAGAPKRAPGLAPGRPSSSVPSTGPAPRDVRPKTSTTTTTTTTERRALGSKVTTSPAARPPAGPAPNRNGTAAASKTATAAASRTAGAARMTAAPRPALSAAAKKPLASKPDSKLGEDRKPGPLKTSADPPKPRTTAAAGASRTGAPKPASASITERKTLVSRAPRPAAPSSSTARTSASRPGTAPSPDPKAVRSKVGAVEKTKVPHTGVKVSSTAQSKAAAAKDPAKVSLDFRKPDFSHITSRLGSKENLKHIPGGGNVQILSKKVDLSKVTSKCGSKDNIKHKPGGGVVKIESHKVNFKDKAQSKVGSMDNLLGTAGKGDGGQEPAEEGSVQAPSVSTEPGPQEAPAAAAQENGLKEGGACGGEGLCDAPVLDTLIPETN